MCVPSLHVTCMHMQSFSGSEADYVVLSMVRSKPLKQIKDKTAVLADRKWRMENLGMVADSHHLCVALTRARFGLVIIGEFPGRFPSANSPVLLYLSLLQLHTYQCVNVGVQECRPVNCGCAFDAVYLPL